MRHNLIHSPLRAAGILLSAALAAAACDSGSSDSQTGESGEGGGSGAAQTASGEGQATGGAGGNGGNTSASAGTKEYTETISAGSVSEEGYTLGPVAMGNPDAPVTVIEYASMTCPHCANFHKNVLPKLKRDYIATGQVRYEFRNFVLNPLDLAVSAIVRCQEPERFFPLTDLLFSSQNDWMGNAQDREKVLSDLASVLRRAGVSRSEIDRCLNVRKLKQHLTEMTQTGQDSFNVNATPTIIVDGEPRGRAAQSFDTLSQMIEEAL